MGSRERRQRHRARVRRAILVAPRELFAAEGVQHVSHLFCLDESNDTSMKTKAGTQVSKRQVMSVLAAIPSTIGMCHLAVYLKLGTPAEGWASLTGFFVALPGWMALARRYRRE